MVESWVAVWYADDESWAHVWCADYESWVAVWCADDESQGSCIASDMSMGSCVAAGAVASCSGSAVLMMSRQQSGAELCLLFANYALCILQL